MDSKYAIQSWFDRPNQQLKEMVNHAKKLDELKPVFNHLIGAKLASHCTIANYKDDTTLVLAIDSSSWLSKIRYQSGDIINELQKHPAFCCLKKIECFVDRDNIVPKKAEPTKQREVIPMSKESKKLVKNAALAVKDKNLKKALLKLAE